MSRGFGSSGAASTDIITSSGASGAIKTYFFWVYRTVVASTSDRFFDEQITNVGNLLAWSSANIIFVACFLTNNGNWTIPLPSLNAWHGVVVSFDGTSVSNNPVLYVDQTKPSVTQTATPIGAYQTTTNFVIGNTPGSGRVWNGLIADCAVWNVILTDGEAFALTAGARPGQIRPTALQNWLPLDGLQSPEPDLSGKARNGTLTGTVSSFGPPYMQFTPRWHRFLGSAPVLPAAGLGWIINRRNKLGQR